jgi:hypothetical protein
LQLPSVFVQGFCEAPMSSSSSPVQQLTCAARSTSFLDHKSSSRSSSSSTTWRRYRSTKRRSLLLPVYVHPQSHFTHQHHLHYTALVPRAQQRIETETALRDHNNCILYFVVLLSLSLSLSLSTALFSWSVFPEYVDLISSEANRKIGHSNTPMRSNYMIWNERKFFSAGGQREKLWRDFFLDPSQWWDHRSEKVTEHQILSEFTCQWIHSFCRFQSCCSLFVAILPWSKLGINSFEVLSTGGIIVVVVVVVGWRS